MAAADVAAGPLGLGGGAAAAGFSAAGAASAEFRGMSTPPAVATAALPLVAGVSAPPPSLRNRDGASSGKVVSGCNSRARASRTPSDSRFAGSGMQQSTGQTAAQAS